MKTRFSARATKSRLAKPRICRRETPGWRLKERLDGPLLGHGGSLDAPVECGLLLAVPLGAQQAEQELAVGQLLLLRVLQLLFDDLADLAEVQGLEQLVELVVAHALLLLIVGVAAREVVVADVAQDHCFDSFEVV